MEGRRFELVDGEATTGVRLHPERLAQPLRWRKPRRVFVNSLSDLFHEEVPDDFIAQVFDTMRLAPQHFFQVLTKRPERAAELVPELYDYAGRYEIRDYADDGVALPNVWLGVSIENARFTWRADVLRQIPAAVRFVSAEPLLGTLFPETSGSTAGEGAGRVGRPGDETEPRRRPLDLTAIDWVIVGGESGPGSRPMRLEWADQIIANAREHCVAPFVKQLGSVWAKQVRAEYGMRPDSKGGDWQHWPERLRIREFPARLVVAA